MCWYLPTRGLASPTSTRPLLTGFRMADVDMDNGGADLCRVNAGGGDLFRCDWHLIGTADGLTGSRDRAGDEHVAGSRRDPGCSRSPACWTAARRRPLGGSGGFHHTLPEGERQGRPLGDRRPLFHHRRRGARARFPPVADPRPARAYTVARCCQPLNLGLRLNTARRLIVDTNLAIAEVAVHLPRP